jgi:hypothetical protein
MQELLVVGRAFVQVCQYCIGLIHDGRIPVVTAQIRMLFQFLHQSAVTGLDYFAGRIRLYMENSIIITSVFHGSTSNLFLRARFKM